MGFDPEGMATGPEVGDFGRMLADGRKTAQGRFLARNR